MTLTGRRFGVGNKPRFARDSRPFVGGQHPPTVMAKPCQRRKVAPKRPAATRAVENDGGVEDEGRPAAEMEVAGEVLSTAAAIAYLKSAFDRLSPADLREWLSKRDGFRCRRFNMPYLGECWLDYSELTCRAGLGLFSCGEAQVGLAAYPAWDHHGSPDCSICLGERGHELSLGSVERTHTFCPRCVYKTTGDSAHIVDNLLYLANHTIVSRSNARWSADTKAKKLGRIRLTGLKQTSPCHREFLINYNRSVPPTSEMKTDKRICVVHRGGPRIMKARVPHPAYHMCAACYQRMKRQRLSRMGVCPSCDQRQAEGGPVCDACKRRFDRFVQRRSMAELGALTF
jgi:hypothetical protein